MAKQGGFAGLVGTAARAEMQDAARETAREAEKNPSDRSSQAPMSLDEFEKVTGQETPFSDGNRPTADEALQGTEEVETQEVEQQAQPEPEVQATEGEYEEYEDEEEEPQTLTPEEMLAKYAESKAPAPAETPPTPTAPDPNTAALQSQIEKLNEKLTAVAAPAPQPVVDKTNEQIAVLERLAEEEPDKANLIYAEIANLRAEQKVAPLQQKIAAMEADAKTASNRQRFLQLQDQATRTGGSEVAKRGDLEAALVNEYLNPGSRQQSTIHRELSRRGERYHLTATSDPQMFADFVQGVARDVTLALGSVDVTRQPVTREQEAAAQAPAPTVQTTGLGSKPSSQAKRRGKKKPPPKSRSDTVRDEMVALARGRKSNPLDRFSVGG